MRGYFDTILAGRGASRHTLMGQPLRPYCLAHAAGLDSVRSPLLSDGVGSPLDFHATARVCACGDFASLGAAFDREPTDDEMAHLARVAGSPEALAAEPGAWRRTLA